ncbi:hypothetical protein ACFQY4_11955 [Catellatospora bangladeshensis]|uniref:Uncharacterized protein n=1 Tax=Catellatospora bangladeshensis TaxID=310355 RepID=A0A8J3JS90_9ACTN|nr:hypothetical protein [Catellatospora bangladeshensis]GIF85987.1 hypothetical protein Cba03nite_73360 [Catellatospora bangladeshensis]
MRVLNAGQFAEYARRQIAAADEILTRHGRVAGDLCRCERPWPCPVAASCVSMREHYRARMAVIEATMRLPVVGTAPVSRLPVLRRLVGGLVRAVRWQDR